ncbi:MAG TPA: FUSC family protein [Edaphobacter sp.]|nr:FUSC family protein [Edaphobacter sp.]
MLFPASWVAALRRLHWIRGLRAGIAVAAAMIVCRYLGQPMGWAALGGFEAILVDNGGPYRSRLTTILTLLVVGSIAGIAGAMAATPLWFAIIVTAVFCFAITFARVMSNQLASTSVIILVIYFVGFGGFARTFHEALLNSLAFVLGGLWAALLSVFLWPLDPFRPARTAVADCYALLADFTAGIHASVSESEDRNLQRQRMHDLQRHMRRKMEAARTAIGTTSARVTARTIRARSLTVLLETADLLFAGTIRWTELFEETSDEASVKVLTDLFHWLARAEQTIENALRQKPADGAVSFASDGSHSLEHLRKRQAALRLLDTQQGSLAAHLMQDQRDALLNVGVAFEAIRALWSGIEYRAADATEVVTRRSLLSDSRPASAPSGWRAMIDAAIANWTPHSVMMRHALRMMVVGAVDVLLMRMVHISHGTWLGMTSIIVLQPYGSGTLRRGAQRVGGTIAGGVLAAILAAALPSQTALIVVITLTSILTLATYAVDYGWYCFFLTPTFVLMSLPHLRDWHYAGIRIGMTTLGASVAVLAMRLLWPERAQLELGRLLARGALADAAYVRAMLQFWDRLGAKAKSTDRAAADRKVLAPARRACGLAINDAEETLDRILLEPRIPLSRGERWEEALTFVTYLRRITRAVTTLAYVDDSSESTRQRAESVAERLEQLSRTLQIALDGKAAELAPREVRASSQLPNSAEQTPAEQQLRRMERQTNILERSAAALMIRP